MTTNLLYLQSDPEHEKDITFMQDRQLEVFTTDTVEEACALLSHHTIHLLFINLELKEVDGMDFVRHLREKGIFIPVIMTFSNTDTTNLMEAINLNVTQCLIKPYTPQDLCDALKVATKKSSLCHALTYTDLNFGYAYDPIAKHITSIEGKTIKLCHKEALLIELLLQNGEDITSYEMIENIVWEDSFMSVESLRTLIRGIRQKTHKNIITNHNGIGYKIAL